MSLSMTNSQKCERVNGDGSQEAKYRFCIVTPSTLTAFTELLLLSNVGKSFTAIIHIFRVSIGSVDRR